ncbi:PilW family protein [Snodgrassella gandavensis]|uniref:PilW family protein n=1 Tax=Snodgrassella gandavensis TaxID=2946698 RepID=UPI001EF69696|nr:prepilin-type N-terminal cleavage/methylation domain-containing protein [Snodgrassella gandavensis]
MKKSYHVQINQDNVESKFNSSSVVILHKQRGFSLIEIMVASIISIIILLAASSTFLTTYKLKEEVKTRINYEQDVRNAANLLRSDARKLGNFGCITKMDQNGIVDEIFEGSFDDDRNNQFVSTEFDFGQHPSVLVTPLPDSKPLLITYLNEEYASTITAEECIEADPDLGEDDVIDGVLYVVGTTNDNPVPGLYRVNYDGNKAIEAPTSGKWSTPQLLVSNVTNIHYSFNYDGHTDATCPKPNSPVQPVDNPVSDDKLNFNFNKPPILITATLTINPQPANPNGNTVDYAIKAMVRQGEVCINNQVQQ